MADYTILNLLEVDDTVSERVPGLGAASAASGSTRVTWVEAGPDGLELIAVGGPKPEGGDGALAGLLSAARSLTLPRDPGRVAQRTRSRGGIRCGSSRRCSPSACC